MESASSLSSSTTSSGALPGSGRTTEKTTLSPSLGDPVTTALGKKAKVSQAVSDTPSTVSQHTFNQCSDSNDYENREQGNAPDSHSDMDQPTILAKKVSSLIKTMIDQRRQENEAEASKSLAASQPPNNIQSFEGDVVTTKYNKEDGGKPVNGVLVGKTTGDRIHGAMDHEKAAGVSANRQVGDQSSTIVMFPCKARGVALNHTFMNSYFQVDMATAQHGQDLICSHELCRKGGVQFQYCNFCRRPVAKQFFRRRHSHRDDVATPPSALALFAETREKINMAVEQTAQDTRKANVQTPTMVTEGNKNNIVSSTPMTSAAIISNKRKANLITSASSSGVSSDSSSSSFTSNKTKTKTKTNPTRPGLRFINRDYPPSVFSAFSALEQEQARGSIRDDMSSLGNGQQGDMSTDDSAGDSSMRVKTLHEYCDEWENLLKERPSDTGGDEMTEWLMKVFAVSASYNKQFDYSDHEDD